MAPPVCGVCGAILSGAYFTAAKLLLCGGCAEGPRRPELVRAGLFGLAGAVGAAFLGILLGSSNGGAALAFLATGPLTGFAVYAGSRGRGGRPFQIGVVALSLAAILSAFVAHESLRKGVRRWVYAAAVAGLLGGWKLNEETPLDGPRDAGPGAGV